MNFGAPELFSPFEPGADSGADRGCSIAKQKSLWYDLISLRLALQPVLEKVNEFSKLGSSGSLDGLEGVGAGENKSSDESTVMNALNALRDSLLALANAVRVVSLPSAQVGAREAGRDDSDPPTGNDAPTTADKPGLPPARDLTEVLPTSSPYVLAELTAWQRAYGQRVGRDSTTSVEQPIATQISYILTDRVRLRRRVVAPAGTGAGADQSGRKSRSVLSDREFYAALLKDFVANSSKANPQEFLRQLQVAKERKAVRKDYQKHLSKNRLINTRKIHRKLVNFVTPKDRPDGEYLRMVRSSIFGN